MVFIINGAYNVRKLAYVFSPHVPTQQNLFFLSPKEAALSLTADFLIP